MIPTDCNRLAEVDFPNYLSVGAMRKPMQVRDDAPPYGGSS